MRHFKKSLASLSCAALSLALLGCVEQNESMDVEETHSMLATTNGLGTVNGLSTTNGLGTVNGLSTTNGLGTVNGLSTTNGLMTTAPGRTTVEYLVRCALPAGASITKKDQYGTSYSFAGELGFAPEWGWGLCGTDCQERISACMLAHINTAGVHIPLWVVAQDPSVGWTLSSDYPNQEGSFFGNIFTTNGSHGAPQGTVAAYYCNGIDYNVDVVPGRIGAHQNGAPYTDPFPGTGYCKDSCTTADAPYIKSGFKACNGWNHIVTVWRKASN